MTKENFDVLLLGQPPAAQLAERLGLSMDQAENILAQGGTIRRNIPLEEAKKVCEKLRALGFACNYRPAQSSGTRLELAPMDISPAEAKFVCPACGHEQAVGENQIQQCERCGVVKDKWEKVQEEKLERERVKRALLRRHQQELQRRMEEKAREEEQKRRQELEEEIRKQLGLPRFMHSRTALFSSASALLVGGISIGVVGALAYQSHRERQATVSRQPTLMERLAGLPLQPGQVPLDPEQLSALAASQITRANGGESRTSGATGDAPPQSVPPGPDRPLPAAQPLPQITEDDSLRNDLEWYAFLSRKARLAAQEQQLEHALRLAHMIPDPSIRIHTLGTIAEIQARQRDAAGARNLLIRIIRQIDTLPAGKRPPLLGEVAFFQHRLGWPQDAATTLLHIEALMDTLEGPKDRSRAWAALALGQFRSGRIREASDSFNQLQTLFSSLEPGQRIRLQAQLADSYRETGQLAVLFNALEQGIRLGHSRNDPEILQLVALGFATTGAPERALGTAGLIPDPETRERVHEEIFQRILYASDDGDGYALLEQLERFHLPYFRLRAAMMLLHFAVTHGIDDRANEYLQAATGASRELHAQPASHALAQAFAGRWLIRSRKTTAGHAAFTEARRLALSLPAGNSRDEVLWGLILHLARAGLEQEAAELLPFFQDNVHRLEAEQQIHAAAPIFAT